MYKISRFAVTAVAICGLAGVITPANASECGNKIPAALGELVNGEFGSVENVYITTCEGLKFSFKDGSIVDVKSSFESEAGYDLFAENLRFIVTNISYMGTVSSTILDTEGSPFVLFPNLSSITADHSDLALSLSGAAETIVFKYDDVSPIMVLKIQG